MIELSEYPWLSAYNVIPLDVKPNGSVETTPEVITYKGECDITDNEFKNSKRGDVILTEREQLVVALLTGNIMEKTEIAEAIGLSLAATNYLLMRLVEAGAITYEGPAKQRKYRAKRKV